MQRLLPEVELAQHRFAELVEERRDAEAPSELGMLVEEGGHFAERLEIVEHLLADAGPLDLERHLAPVAQYRAVHLRDRGGGDRLRLDALEGFGETHAELFCQDFLDFVVAEGLDMVLQPRQGVGVNRRNDVGTRRKQLRELDVRRSELLDVARELLRLWNALRLVDRLLREKLAQAGALHHVAPPVLEEQAREILVAFEMLGTQREVHSSLCSNLQTCR